MSKTSLSLQFMKNGECRNTLLPEMTHLQFHTNFQDLVQGEGESLPAISKICFSRALPIAQFKNSCLTFTQADMVN